eukprot:11518622-Karenia_brevis.AAC.1
MEIQEELFGPDLRTLAVRANPSAGAGRPTGTGGAALSAGVDEYTISTPPPAGPLAANHGLGRHGRFAR